MSQKLENAKGLYLEGIKDGQIAAVDKYTGNRYTQHSTGVADGAQGFKDFFSGFLERTKDRDIRVVRAIEDGSFVFVHVYQNIDNGQAKWVTTDLFDTDENDKLVEHWDVIAAYVEPSETASGNDMVLGDFEIEDLDKTEANKARVRSFITDVFQNKNHAALDQYISKETYIQHNPNVPDGFAAVEQFLATQDFNYDFVRKIIGQGNFVVSLSQCIYNDQAFCVFDIFRIEDDKIVEHWDNMEPIPLRSQWVNSGKF